LSLQGKNCIAKNVFSQQERKGMQNIEIWYAVSFNAGYTHSAVM
jgi:hypothetical protein